VINGNFFSPCCNAVAEPKTFSGLAVSDANVVGLPVSTVGQNAALTITRKNEASLVETTEQMDLSNVFTAVTGSGIESLSISAILEDFYNAFLNY
jgi:hypothetical protein